MNIEESIKILKELKENKWGELLNCWDYGTEAQKAIETLLTAYEKEKEKNKKLIKQNAIEIIDVDGNSIKIDLDGKIHNVYKIKEE